MGSYIDKSDLDLALSRAELTGLTDDEGAGIPNDEVIARAIADAEALVESYAGKRYAVPLSSATAMVKRLCVVIARFNLCDRRRNMPESVRETYQDAIKLLQDVSTGKAKLDGLSEAESASGKVTSAGVVDGGERIFDRQKLKVM
ncbi:MAG: hypothetical protein A2V67_04870 [Deltaproteobacteria bacterium RBG_13_61_14]|nr:MAG: hypothetical protein A2V67_04870 [Deltaproteobacteria bacterium RBG_13_61_14]